MFKGWQEIATVAALARGAEKARGTDTGRARDTDAEKARDTDAEKARDTGRVRDTDAAAVEDAGGDATTRGSSSRQSKRRTCCRYSTRSTDRS
jgi:hypothetical protein